MGREGLMFPSIDEGDLAMKVFVKRNKLIIDFGKDLSWIGLNSEDVDILIATLTEKRKDMK